MNDEGILQLFARPWAIEPSALRLIVESVVNVTKGTEPAAAKTASRGTSAGSEAAAGDFGGSGRPFRLEGSTAVIPIEGTISKRLSPIFAFFFGGTSVESVRTALQAAEADDQVERILLDIDSPGGSVNGISDLADEIRATSKPVIAYSDGLMASAAYWLGVAADQVFASAASQVGSIGVLAVVDDISVALHNHGIKTTIIKAGEHKAAGHPDQPFTEKDREVIQEEVNDFYELFTGAVGRFRSMSRDDVLSAADGRVFIGSKALEKGLIDGIRSRGELGVMLADNETGVTTMKEKQAKAEAAEQERLEAEEAEKVKAEEQAKAEAAARAKEVDAGGLDEEALKLKAREEERERLCALDAIATDWPSHKELVDQCKADGTSAEETKQLVFAAATKLNRAELAAARKGEEEPLGGGNTDHEAKAFSEEAVKERWEAGDTYLHRYYSDVNQAIRYERAKHGAAQQRAQA